MRKPKDPGRLGTHPQGKTPAAMTEEQRAYAVSLFATYMKTSDVLKELTERFGREFNDSIVQRLNIGRLTPEKVKQYHVSKWVPLFEEARDQFNACTRDVAVASKTYRLRKLDQMFDNAFAKRNYTMAAKLLEQAAKEANESYSNVRKIEGAIDHKHEVEEVPDDVKRGTIATALRAAMADVIAAQIKDPKTSQPAPSSLQ